VTNVVFLSRYSLSLFSTVGDDAYLETLMTQKCDLTHLSGALRFDYIDDVTLYTDNVPKMHPNDHCQRRNDPITQHSHNVLFSRVRRPIFTQARIL
jgi:hypothetical protein